MKQIGIYIHIPFCKKKCLYCDFISFNTNIEMQKRYVQALKEEISNWLNKNPNIEIKTIYIGGGTPSFIDSKSIVEILEIIFKYKNNLINNPEVTIEVNPGTVSEQKLRDYKEAGVNRISIGLQSAKDELLKQLGRVHTYEEFLEAYMLARKVGFNNINVDLMIGLPNQTIQDIKSTLKNILDLKPIKPEHISVYSLIVEEETPIQKMIDTGILELPQEDEERNMYWYVKDMLELNGYNHYEISNFSKITYESKHNLDCWNQKEYRGFGIAAHSYIDGKRFCNISDIELYIKNINENNFNDNIIIQEEQSLEQQMKEYMLIGLRKLEGVSIKKFKNKFNDNPILIFRNELSNLNEEGLIIIDGDNIKLSNKGLDLANIVWEEFV